MELTAEEIRVLGCLVEKEATTPDSYPLSTNGLVLACNQRSSRDPVVEYDEGTVTSTMLSLRERNLARTSRGEGGRVYKHAHTLREALNADGPELAVLSVLMLRGPQTPGELRTRAERQHEFASLEDVGAVLEQLARRDPPLVEQLPRNPGQKEVRWAHLLREGAPLRGTRLSPADFSTSPADVDAVVRELEVLRDEVAALRIQLDELRRLSGESAERTR